MDSVNGSAIFLFLVEWTLLMEVLSVLYIEHKKALSVTNFKLVAIYMHDAININQRLSLEVAIHVCFIPPIFSLTSHFVSLIILFP
jgi:hypothetical protein